MADAQVAQVLDLIDRRDPDRHPRGLHRPATPRRALDGLRPRGRDAASTPSASAENLVGLLRDLVVLRIAPDAPQLVEGSAEEVAELRALAARCDAARLRRMFRALVKEQEDLAWAPQPFAVLEMAVVRLATLPAGDEVAALLARLEALEARLRGAGPGRLAARACEPRRRERPPRRAAARSAVRRAGEAAPLPDAAGAGSGARCRARAARIAPAGGGLRPPARLRAAAGSGPLRGARGRTAGPHRGARLCARVPAGFARAPARAKRAPLERCCARFFGRPMAIELEIAGRARRRRHRRARRRTPRRCAGSASRRSRIPRSTPRSRSSTPRSSRSARSDRDAREPARSRGAAREGEADADAPRRAAARARPRRSRAARAAAW